MILKSVFRWRLNLKKSSDRKKTASTETWTIEKKTRGHGVLLIIEPEKNESDFRDASVVTINIGMIQNILT